MRIQLAAALLILAACADSEASVGYTVDTSATGVVTVSNSTPSDWSDTSGQWRIMQVAKLEGSDDTAGAIVSPSRVASDGAGRLLVVEQSPAKLWLLQPDGTRIRQFGREGEGPGEYRRPTPIAVGPYIVIDDPQLARLTVYDTAGAVLRTYPAPCCHYARIFGDDSSRVYMQTSTSGDSTASAGYVRINVESGTSDTVMLPRIGPEQKSWQFRTENMSRSYSVPYQPSDLTAILPSGHVLRGWSGKYEYLERTFEGDSLRVVRRAWVPVERPEAARRERFGMIREMIAGDVDEVTADQVMDFADIPTEAEPMPVLFADGAGNVWVPIFVPGAETLTLDIFSPDGIWRGTLNTPWALDEYPVWLGDNEVVTRGSTEEGYPLIRMWKVER